MAEFPTDIKTLRERARANPTTRRILEDILAVEEEHADDLLSILEEMGTSSQ